jgi:hypothetical protein
MSGVIRKVVIASDSFKGSISSIDVADVCEKAINFVFPTCNVVKLGVGDGGEGTLEALVCYISIYLLISFFYILFRLLQMDILFLLKLMILL